MTEQSVVQTLKDAGCELEFIHNFMELRESGQKKAALLLLKDWRKALLDCIHENQYKLDCLDYLLWKMERNEQ